MRCPSRRFPAFEARVAFLVVSLTDGRTTGGMVATPKGRASSFSLGSLGEVTSWLGPMAFGSRPEGLGTVVVDTPHLTGQ